MTDRRRFTLVELMIVVGIVAVLAAIAVPKLEEQQYRAKLTEVSVNVDQIDTLMVAYNSAFDTWLTSTPAQPHGDAGDLDDVLGAWGKTAFLWEWISPHPSWTTLGWIPSGGQARCAYQMFTVSNKWRLDTICNVDGTGMHYMRRLERDARTVNIVTDSLCCEYNGTCSLTESKCF